MLDRAQVSQALIRMTSDIEVLSLSSNAAHIVSTVTLVELLPKHNEHAYLYSPEVRVLADEEFQ